MDLFKDVEIAGVPYQIGRLKARAGSWTLAQILTKMLPSVIENAFNIEGAALPGGRGEITEFEFHNLQGHALAVCRRYEHGAPMPIFVQPNTFVIPDLEYDLTTVMALTVESLVFNLTPFFRDGGLAQVLGTLKAAMPIPPEADPNSPAIPASTPTLLDP